MAGHCRSGSLELDIYRKLDEYRWDEDQEFQGGLSAILGPDPISTQVQDLTLRAKCFYLSRKLSTPISFDGYKSYLLLRETSAQSSYSGETCSQAPLIPRRENLSPNSTETPLSHQVEVSVSPETTPDKTAPYPSNFTQIIELITSGSPIPGIREIPSIVVPEQASIPKAPKREKPWENCLSAEQMDDGVFDGLENIIPKQKNLQ